VEARAYAGLSAATPNGRIVILIPAAGAARRMRGRDKLLEPVDGIPLLRRQAQRALETGAHVIVTLPTPDSPRFAALAGLPLQIVFVPDATEGMAASVRRGAAAAPDGIAALIILPADMPDLETGDLLLLINGFQSEISPTLQQATAADGTPGHPVLFPADCLPALQMLSGDQGARDVLRANAHRLRRIALQGMRALTDLDTPEDWETWRRARTPCAGD
jgi:CTP:molybdopterin cytidylyltransferase MocA